MAEPKGAGGQTDRQGWGGADFVGHGKEFGLSSSLWREVQVAIYAGQ